MKTTDRKIVEIIMDLDVVECGSRAGVPEIFNPGPWRQGDRNAVYARRLQRERGHNRGTLRRMDYQARYG